MSFEFFELEFWFFLANVLKKPDLVTLPVTDMLVGGLPSFAMVDPHMIPPLLDGPKLEVALGANVNLFCPAKRHIKTALQGH